MEEKGVTLSSEIRLAIDTAIAEPEEEVDELPEPSLPEEEVEPPRVETPEEEVAEEVEEVAEEVIEETEEVEKTAKEVKKREWDGAVRLVRTLPLPKEYDITRGDRPGQVFQVRSKHKVTGDETVETIYTKPEAQLM